MSMTIAAAAANLLGVLALDLYRHQRPYRHLGEAVNTVCDKKWQQRRPEESQSQDSNPVDSVNQYLLLLS